MICAIFESSSTKKKLGKTYNLLLRNQKSQLKLDSLVISKFLSNQRKEKMKVVQVSRQPGEESNKNGRHFDISSRDRDF
jgi:hypothetical protein